MRLAFVYTGAALLPTYTPQKFVHTLTFYILHPAHAFFPLIDVQTH